MEPTRTSNNLNNFWKEEFMDKEVESFGRTLTIKQSFSGELGATVWDASLVLIKYFENLQTFPIGFWNKKRVLELGCGTGLVSIVVGLLGADVIATDRKPLLDLIQENVELNKIAHRVTVEELEWGDSTALAKLNPPFDIILASDVVANCYEESQPKLIQTLLEASKQETLIIMSHELRDKKDLDFWRTLKEQFDIKKIPNSDLDETWQSDDIGVFHVNRHKS